MKDISTQPFVSWGIFSEREEAPLTQQPHSSYGLSSSANQEHTLLTVQHTLSHSPPSGVRWPHQMVFSCCWGSNGLGPRFGLQGPPWSGPRKTADSLSLHSRITPPTLGMCLPYPVPCICHPLKDALSPIRASFSLPLPCYALLPWLLC